jgi:hypothetical protein
LRISYHQESKHLFENELPHGDEVAGGNEIAGGVENVLEDGDVVIEVI